MDLKIREFVFNILEIAKQNLQSDGFLVPVAFVVSAHDIIPIAVSFQGPEEKELKYREVIEMARKKKALAIVTLNDAHYSDHATKEFVDSYYWGKLAAESAPECIYMTVSGPGIKTWDLTVPYEKTRSEIIFGEPRESSGGEFHLLAGWASDSPNPS